MPPAFPDKPSIAVLPFDNLSGDPDQEFFADGMAEDIIAGLSRFRWLFVIARSSTFGYKGKSPDVRDVSRELGVRYVLEGSTRKGGNRIRVVAQLIDALTGNHIWAESYDRELEDIFAVQDEVRDAIVAAIAPEIDAAERVRAERKPPESLDAWDLYQRGLGAYYTTTESGLETAIELFDQVNKLDPLFAPAFAMAADTRVRLMMHYRLREPGLLLSQAQEKAQKGIALDQRDPICLWADGRVNTFLGQHELAIWQIKEAVTLNPNYSMAYYTLAFVLTRAGRADEAISHFDQAIRLSPHDAFLAGFQVQRALALFDLKRYEECVEWAYRASRSPNPRYWSFVYLAAALIELGRKEEARAALDKLMALAPHFTLSFLRGWWEDSGSNAENPLVDALRKAGLSG